MDPLTALVLVVVASAVGFYVLYLVVRAAVRDGILQAREAGDRADQGPGDRVRPS